MRVPSFNIIRAMSYSENPMLESLAKFLKLGLPLSLTYYIKQGISVTNQVLVRDVISQSEEPELVLANGTLIPISRVINIQYPESPKPQLRKPFSEQEIFKFQLPNWSEL